jgi:hypothetical protein
VYFCPHSYTPGKNSQSVTDSEIAPSQTRLTPEFFIVELSEKKVYLIGMSILINHIKSWVRMSHFYSIVPTIGLSRS